MKDSTSNSTGFSEESVNDPINDYRSKEFQGPSDLEIKNLADRMKGEGLSKDQVGSYIDGLFDGAPHGSALQIKQRVLSQFNDPVEAPQTASVESSPVSSTDVPLEEEVPSQDLVQPSELGPPDEQTGFFGGETDEKFGFLDPRSSNFINPLTSKEIGTAVTIATEGFTSLFDETSSNIATDVEQTGVTNLWEMGQEEVQSLKASFGSLEGDPVQALQDIQEEVEIVQIQPDLLTAYKGTVERLREQGLHEDALKLVTLPTELIKLRQLEQIYSKAQMDAFENASTVEVVYDLGESFLDLFGALERAQRRDVVADLSGNWTDKMKVNFLRSSDIKDIVDNKWDRLSFEDQKTLIYKTIQAVKESENAVGMHNTIYASDVLTELEDALSGEYGVNDWISWLEATGVAAPVARLIKNAKNLVKIGSIKAFKARDSYVGFDVSGESEDIMSAMDDWIRLFDPEADVANNLRIEREVPLTPRQARDQDTVQKVSSLQETSPLKQAPEPKRPFKLKDTARAVQKALEPEVQAVPSSSAPKRITGIRMGNSTLGNLAVSMSPTTLSRIINQSKETPEQILARLGMDPDSVMMGSIPSPADEILDGINPRVINPSSTVPRSSDLTGRKSAVEIYESRPLDQVIRPDELQVTRSERLQRIQKLSGDTLSLHAEKSGIQTFPGGMRVTGRFGESDMAGFRSFDDAEMAGKNMVGEQFEVVYKVPNQNKYVTVTEKQDLPYEYFVQVKYDRQLTAGDALKFSDTKTKYNSNFFFRLFSTYSDRISKDIIDNVSVMKDYDLAVANRLEETLKPYTKLKGEAREAVNFALMRGDAQMVNYSFSEFSALLMNRNLISKSLSRISKEWQGYKAVRDFYSDLADIKDMRVRAELEEQGFKNIVPLKEGNNKVFGVPKTVKEVQSSGAKLVYDTRTKSVVPVKGLQEQEGVAIVKLKGKKTFEDAGDFDLVVIPKDKAEPLPQNVINRRDGYVNREYKKNGAKISVVGPETVNGVLNKTGKVQTIRFGDSVEDVEKWLKKKATNSGKTNRQVLEEDLDEGFTLQVDLTREELYEMSEISVNSSGNVTPYNLRARGKQKVEHIRGASEVFTVEESITKSLRGMESTLNRDSISIMKRRWLDQYGKFLKMDDSGYTFPEVDDIRSGSLKSKDAGGNLIPDDEIKNAVNLHSYIRSQELMLGMRQKDEFDDFLSLTVNFATMGRLDKTPLELTKFVSTAMVIYGRPLFQIAGNALQTLMLTTRDPVRGTASIVETLPILALMGIRRLGTTAPKGAEAVLVKLSGFKNTDEFNTFYDAIETSGIVSAGRLDNLLSNIGSGRTIHSGSKKRTALNVAATPFNAIRGSQSMATDFANLVAFRHAFKLVPELHKGLSPFTRKGLTKANTIMRELTFRMNKTDTLSSETDPFASLILMWTQHVYKGWKDTIAQPVVKSLTNKDISKNPSIWANDRKQALYSVASTLTLFGGAGILPSEYVLELDEKARRFGILEPGETFHGLFYEGLLDKMLKGVLGVDVNSAERFSFSDAPTMILDLSGIAQGALNIFGGSVVAGTRLGQLVQTALLLDSDMIAEEGDALDMLKFFASESASLFSGFSDYEKASLAKNFEMYFTSNGNALYKTGVGASLGAMFSLRPDEAMLRERTLFAGKGGPQDKKLFNQVIPQMFARWFWQRMLEKNEEFNGNMPYREYTKEITRFARMIDVAANKRGNYENAETAKRAFFNLAVDPTGTFTERDMLEKAQNFVETVNQNNTNASAKAKLSQLISLSDDPLLVKEAKKALQILEYNEEESLSTEEINDLYNVSGEQQ